MSRRPLDTTQALPAVAPPPAVSLVALCTALFKVRIGFAITLAALGGAVLAAGQWPPLLDTLILSVAVLLAASGAGAYNHYYDRDIDAVMGRTRGRPFVNGLISARTAWPVLFFAMIAAGSGLAAWHFNLAAGLFTAAGALTYAIVYTMWLKRRTDLNIVIGGAAGSWAVLAGAAATGEFGSTAVLWLALVLFLWTPSHFWSLAIALADDYRRAKVPMLPVTRGVTTAVRWNWINTLLLAASTVALAVVVNTPLLWLGALAGSGWLLWTTWQMVRDPVRGKAMTAFKASLIQLGALLAGLFTAFMVPG
ncbi:protoheme IX farnesyltransferase [Wenzhouxiangella sp. AB-CW3]|uniref:heme o synthase n=1 Tax=Wenzhouxiangella sp. AB-CW3 TaxID=2771012 RepID=UPI00168BB057|nr:heme o synthase [Wenzhouxiangella sp. AB-CW3]QOC22502.1 protoheme IX farnesyltransferase [Wenzhouxiangella sp. AB-CW3]